jgi:hypothetical protein
MTMPKDPSFDSYLDQQIDEHTRPELECGCTGVVTWPFDDHYCGKEEEDFSTIMGSQDE